MLILTVAFVASTTGLRSPIKTVPSTVVSVAHRYPIDPLVPSRVRAHQDVQAGLWAGYINPCVAPYGATGDGVADVDVMESP